VTKDEREWRCPFFNNNGDAIPGEMTRPGKISSFLKHLLFAGPPIIRIVRWIMTDYLPLHNRDAAQCH
jgi:hypothetical protein